MNPFGADKLELLFGKLDRDAADAFRPTALLSLVGEFGSDPLGAGFGSFAAPVAVQVSVLSAVRFPRASFCCSPASVGRRCFAYGIGRREPQRIVKR